MVTTTGLLLLLLLVVMVVCCGTGAIAVRIRVAFDSPSTCARSQARVGVTVAVIDLLVIVVVWVVRHVFVLVEPWHVVVVKTMGHLLIHPLHGAAVGVLVIIAVAADSIIETTCGAIVVVHQAELMVVLLVMMVKSALLEWKVFHTTADIWRRIHRRMAVCRGGFLLDVVDIFGDQDKTSTMVFTRFCLHGEVVAEGAVPPAGTPAKSEVLAELRAFTVWTWNPFVWCFPLGRALLVRVLESWLCGELR